METFSTLLALLEENTLVTSESAGDVARDVFHDVSLNQLLKKTAELSVIYDGLRDDIIAMCPSYLVGVPTSYLVTIILYYCLSMMS